MQQFNVVISGFERYPGVEVNPAVEVPRALAEQGLGAVAGDFEDPLADVRVNICLLYTSPSPRDGATSRMPSSA